MSDRLCSKDVADLMEKRHDNLMRTIRKDLMSMIKQLKRIVL